MRVVSVASDSSPEPPGFSDTGSSRLMPPPYYVKALALGIPAYLIGVHLWTWILTIPLFLGGRADFRQLYTAGYMVRTGHAHQLYDYDSQRYFQSELVSQSKVALVFIRPAYEALVLAPLSLLPYRVAYFAFLGANLTLLTVCFRLLQSRMSNLGRVYPWLPWVVFPAFLPIAAALIQGQDSILLLTLFATSLVLLDQGREFAAGVVLGLGLFKFQIVIPIWLLFLAWRRWRFSIGFALASLVSAGMSLLLVGLSQAEVYCRSLFSISMGSAARPDELHYPVPINLMPNIHGLILGLGGNHLSGFWIVAATIFLSCVVLSVLAATPTKNMPGADALLLAITASTIVSYYLFIHDLSVVLIPIVIVMNRSIGAEATGDRSRRLVFRASALMFVAPLCESYMPGYFYLVSLPLMFFLFALMHTYYRPASA
jgi:hypothetical protein